MSKWRILALLVTLSLGFGWAQKSYYGFGGTALISLGDVTEFGFLAGLQLGGPVAYGLELRGSLDTALIASDIGVDLLYPFAVSADTRGYAGGGAHFLHLVFATPDSYGNTFGLHGTAGLEYRTGDTTGLYSEVRPYLLLGDTLIAVKVRAGVNLYF